ncbi:hypothetical protein JFL43_03375 [Viridibacillus sp. YIM B01967]|uniref:Uncharacterized protein n=1 Tax=Viridibacillus soli TaxID=2798301 RepID=A0ABS1H3C0_9BACL|nr:hypothetical protein [Viridibacillus soli]MBK3493913.1 hypothetical protein [Viridibacillus soli]
MIKFITKFAFITVLVIATFTNLPTKTSAATHNNQDITCYNANGTKEYPARSGYVYILGITAASQYKEYNNFSGGPRILCFFNVSTFSLVPKDHVVSVGLLLKDGSIH